MAGINVGDLEAVLRLRDEMSAQIQATMSTLDKLDSALGVTEEALDHVQKHSETAGVAIGVVLGGWIERASERLIEFGKQAFDTAANIQSLGNVSRFLGTQLGYTGVEIDALAGSLNKQGITMVQSRDTIIQLIRANLDLGKANDLAAVAQNAARLSGQNSSDTLNQMIHGIQTLQPEILRSSGIIVNTQLEYQKWAAENHRVESSMSGVEKQQVLLSAVLREGQKIAGVYAVTNEDVKGKLLSLDRVVKDAAGAIGTAFVPAVTQGVIWLTDFLKDVRASPELFRDLGLAIVFVSAALNAEWVIPLTAAVVALDLMMSTLTGTTDPVENFKTAVDNLFISALAVAEAIKTMSGGLIDFKTAAENASLAGDALLHEWLLMQSTALGLQLILAKKSLSASDAIAFTDKEKANVEALRAYIFNLEAEKKAVDAQVLAVERGTNVTIAHGKAAVDAAKALADMKVHAEAVAKAAALAAAAEAAHAAALKSAAAEAKKHAAEIKTLTEQYHAMFSGLTTGKEEDKISVLFKTVIGNLHSLTGGDIVKAVAEFEKLGESGHIAGQQVLEAWDGVGAHLASVRQDEMLKTVEALMKTGDAGVQAAQRYEAAWSKSTGDVLRLVGRNKDFLGGPGGSNVPKLTPEVGQNDNAGAWEIAGRAAADQFDFAFENQAAKRKWFFANFDPLTLGTVKFDAIAKALGIQLDGTVDKTAKVTKATFDWQKAVQTVQSTMQLLGITADSAMGTIVSSIGIAIAGYQGLAAVHKTYTDAVVAHGKDSEQAKEAKDAETMFKVQAAYLAAATAVSIYSKNKENLNAGQAAASGAASGAAAGAAFGPWGMVIGAVVGGLIGFFSGQKWRAMAKAAGDTLGIEMTDAMAKAVDATMKKFNTTAPTAALLNLDKAMSASSKAASTFAPQVIALLAGVATGAIPAKEGVEQITKAWSMMAAEAGDGRVSKEMLAIMAAAKQAGVAVQGIQDFIKGLASKAIPVLTSAWNAMTASGGLSVNEIKNRMASYEESLKTLGLGEDELAAKLAEREHQLRKTAIATDDDMKSMDQLANLTAGAFQAMMESGASLTDIFAQIGPLIDAAVAAYDRLGIAMPAVLQNVVQLRNFVDTNKDLAASMMGWGDVIKLAAAGFGDLKDAVAQVGVHMKQAEDAGLTHAQALFLNRDALREIDYLYTHGLLPDLDEGTKKLLEEGHANGLLDPTPQDRMAGATEHLVEIMALLAEHFGVILPKAIQDYIDSLNRIPKTIPGPPDPNAPLPPAPPDPPPLPAASGYYTPMLARNTLFLAHKDERVEIGPAGKSRGVNANSGGGGGDVTYNLAIDARGATDPQATVATIEQALRNGGSLRDKVTDLARRAAQRV